MILKAQQAYEGGYHRARRRDDDDDDEEEEEEEEEESASVPSRSVHRSVRKPKRKKRVFKGGCNEEGVSFYRKNGSRDVRKDGDDDDDNIHIINGAGNYVGAYLREARRKRTLRFIEKRKHRIWDRGNIRYAVRKVSFFSSM